MYAIFHVNTYYTIYAMMYVRTIEYENIEYDLCYDHFEADRIFFAILFILLFLLYVFIYIMHRRSRNDLNVAKNLIYY